MKKIAVLFVVLFVLIGVFGGSAATPAAKGEFDAEYLVEPLLYRIPLGTNLTRIADLSESTVKRLLELNPQGSRCVKNPDLIFAGCEIVLPLVPEDSHELAVARAASVYYGGGYERGLQGGKQAVRSGLILLVVAVAVMVIIISALLVVLAKKNSRIFQLEEKYGKVSAALKDADTDSRRLCEQVEVLKNENTQFARRVRELVIEKDRLCEQSMDLGCTNRDLNVRLDELNREKEQLSEVVKVGLLDLEYAGKRINALEDRMRSFLTADGLTGLAKNVTVRELIQFLANPIFGNERVKKPTRKLQEVLDSHVEEQKLSGVDSEKLYAMTLEKFLAHMDKGGMVEF